MTSLKVFRDVPNIEYNQLVKIIKSLFDINTEIVEIDYIGSGRINRIFRIKLKNSKIENIILREKICKPQTFESPNREGYLLELLSKNQIENYAHIYYSHTLLNFCLMEYIEGELLSSDYSKKNLEELAILLSKIHSIKLNPNDLILMENEKILFYDIDLHYQIYFNEVLLESKKFFPELSIKVKKLLDKLYVRGLYKMQDISIVHHDLHALNVILGKDGIKLIDWESARFDVYEVEFVKFKHLNYPFISKKNIDVFVKTYFRKRGNIFTKNFVCHEIIWLLKMLIFEMNNKNIDYSYFPSKEYYFNKINEIYEEYYKGE